MNTTSIAVTILSSLVSGIVGVIISATYYRRYDERKLKRDVLQRIVGNRFFLTDELVNERNKDLFIALNEAFVVFSDSPQVIAVIRKMHEELGLPGRVVDNLVSLIKEMAKASGIKLGELNDAFIERPFIPRVKN